MKLDKAARKVVFIKFSVFHFGKLLYFKGFAFCVFKALDHLFFTYQLRLVCFRYLCLIFWVETRIKFEEVLIGLRACTVGVGVVHK